MDRKAMIEQFRIRTQDVVAPYLWIDEELGPWFSEADREAAIRGRLIRDVDSFDIKAGETTVDLPDLLFDIQYAEVRFADGRAAEITPTDRSFLDRYYPNWRTRKDDPSSFMHEDKVMTLDCVAKEDCSIYVEFFRLPKNELAEDGDTSEIAQIHHIHLIDWVLFRAYSKPDSETLDPGKASEGEARFTAYFGKRPNVDMRRRQNASRPHRNRIHP